MPDINISLDKKFEGKSKEELSKVLDVEINRFSDYMTTLGDWKSVGPLNDPERALIKTYLIQKIKGVLDKSCPQV